MHYIKKDFQKPITGYKWKVERKREDDPEQKSQGSVGTGNQIQLIH